MGKGITKPLPVCLRKDLDEKRENTGIWREVFHTEKTASAKRPLGERLPTSDTPQMASVGKKHR